MTAIDVELVCEGMQRGCAFPYYDASMAKAPTMKILMADDDTELLQLAGALLRAAGHATVTARDATQVLPTAMREKPNLILLDINMPGGTGSDALVRLKRSTLTSGIPVVVISGSQKADIAESVRALGADAYIAKPWLPEDFLGQLKQAVPYLAW